jgi:rubredoxin
MPHRHDVVYAGAVNLFDGRWLVGAVDLWRCRVCGETFAEEKRYGVLDVAPEVGFREKPAGTEWAIFVCSQRDVIHWRLVQATDGLEIPHPCPSGANAIIEGVKIRPATSIERGYAHFLFMVKDVLNRGIQVGFREVVAP